MKQPRIIQRLSGLLLATLMLFMAGWGHTGLAQQQALQTKKAARAVDGHTKATQAHNAKSTDAQLTAAQFEAVVMPAPTVGGGSQTAFLLPVPACMILMLLRVPRLRHFTFPHYFFAYLRYVFGHTIAPNAP